ncbi:MAG: PaaI family thioesterase [Halioglobus sp.]|nr:PaaI family thioesterase [Halioglobus sp.]
MANLSVEQKAKAVELMNSIIPHTVSLGLSLESIQGDSLTLKLPYNADLVGNPETGALHGGAVTVLLDQTMGVSAICSDDFEPSVTPTLDLRIDHLGVAPAGRDIYATARVYHATRRVLFVEGFAWCESPDKPIARGTGTWVRVAPINLTWLLDPDKDQGEA